MKSVGWNEFKKTIALGAGLMAATQIAWARGGDSSGGGTVEHVGPRGQAVLVDLMTVDPRFNADAMDPVRAEDRLTLSPLAMTLGFDRIKIQNTAVYRGAVARLNTWQSSSPVIVGMLHRALDEMEWIYTPYHQNVCFPDTLPAGVRADQAEGAVVFDPVFGARISAPVWNQMGRTSLTGLLIHEAGRHVQLMEGKSFSDETLRLITGTIVLRDPQSASTLDQPELYGSGIAAKMNRSGSTRRTMDSICAETQRELSDDYLQRIARNYCVGGQAKPEAGSEAFMQLDELNRVDSWLVSAILKKDSGDRAQARELKRLLALRDSVEGEVNGLIEGKFSDSMEGLAMATHQLDQVFDRVVEDELRKYVNGDHSGVSLLKRIKLNKIVKQVQDAQKKLMSSGTFLKCS